MEELKTRVQKLVDKVNIDEKKKRIRELEVESMKAGFWNDHQTAAKKTVSYTHLTLPTKRIV